MLYRVVKSTWVTENTDLPSADPHYGLSLQTTIWTGQQTTLTDFDCYVVQM